MNTNELLEQAKQDLQAQGGYTPRLAVEFADDGQGTSYTTAFLPGFPDRLDIQRAIMHTTGHKVAAMYPGKDIVQAVLFLHTWAVRRAHAAVPSAPPSEAQDRFEVFVMQTIDVASQPGMKQTEYAAEVIRSGAGIDFLPIDEGIGVDILEDFLGGIECERTDTEEAEQPKKDKPAKKPKKTKKKTKKTKVS